MTVTRQRTGMAGGFGGAPATERLPPCGIQDVDAALLKALSSDMGIAVSGRDGTAKVRVIFAAGERWSQVKKSASLRDANGSLVLPLIAIVRTSVSQDSSEDVCGRGINQQTGKLVVKKRVSVQRDASTQTLINRVNVRGSSVWSSPRSSTRLSRREVGDLLSDRNVAAGGVMVSDLTRSAVEVTTVPAPQFVTVKYDVKIWTSYTSHLNQIAEKIVSNYLPSDRAFKLTTGKGYWFIAYADGEGFALDGNSDSVGDDERVIKATLQLRVPAYVLAAVSPGDPAPTRSAIASPDISFSVPEAFEEDGASIVAAPFLGSDDPTLPKSTSANGRKDMRDDASGKIGATWRRDPALSSLRRGEKLPKYKRDRAISVARIDDRFVRSVSVNAALGETAYSGFELADFEIAVS